MASNPISIQNDKNYTDAETKKAKKPFSAYFYFMAERKKMKQNKYGVCPELIITSLHQEWLQMPIGEKKEWIERANRESY